IKNTDAAKDLHSTKLFIIDECTMLSKYALHVIDRVLRDVMTTNVAHKEKTPFGGKVIVFGGDFRQCLPVIPHVTRTDVVQSCIKYSQHWQHFTRLPLINNMRSIDPHYSSWLLQLGNGELSNEHNLGDDVIEIPPDMVCTGSLIIEIFGDNLCIDVNDTESINTAVSHAILCPKNEDVEKVNSQVMDLLIGDYTEYISDDSIDPDEADDLDQYPLEFLNSLTPTGMPSHRLKLKIGTIVMLLRNVNTNKGLCNGTRLIVTALHANIILAKVISGSAAGNVVFIPRIDLCPSETGLPFKLRRRQFPIKPAFAMTINKSQGQTLHRVGIYLPEPAFAHGQLTVPHKTSTSCALDCGAGIGRITKRLLLPLFKSVDMVDVTDEFLSKAKSFLGEDGKRIGDYYCCGLQDFLPEANHYYVIWIQWDNMTQEGVIMDEVDSSVCRDLDLVRRLIRQAGLSVLAQERQENFPEEIYHVYSIAMR
ncbi:unnamed protein product, partial [Ranitomeya imitator]